jgi:hypothetical protein
MAVAIMQPYFFPYLGYFQLVQAVEHFVLYDDVMFIKKGWINRNRIWMQGQDFMFTIPLEKQSQNKTIRESTVAWNADFPSKFLVQLRSAYKKAPHVDAVMNLIEGVLAEKPISLADLAGNSIQASWNYLGLTKKFYFSSELSVSSELGRAERLMEITKSFGESVYINAANGQALYDKPSFALQGVDLQFIQVDLPAYPQGNSPDFLAGLSMIDVLMWNDIPQIREMLTHYKLV